MSRGAEELAAVQRIEQVLAGLRYGTIEIVVHDSKIAYIERRERFRIAAPEDSPGKGPATARAEEREQSAENRLFAEFGYPTALVPNRDIGVALRGDVAGRRLNYYVGASNGTSDGASVDADTDDSKTVTLRLLATPFRQSKALEAFMLGIAGTYGDSTGGLPSDYRTVGQQFFYRWLKPTATSMGVVLDGEVRRLAPQMYWFAGPFGMMAEYVSSSQELGIDGSLATIENTAWQVGVSWVLTGENAIYKGVAPERPVAAKGGGGSGAWQLVARYTELDVEDEAFPVFADAALSASAAQTVTVGVNWYATSQVRFLVNYSHTDFDEATSDVSFAEEQAIVARIQFRF